MTEWTNLVKTMFKNGRKTNKNYKLKNAMKDAAKVYKKKNKSTKMNRKSRKGRRRYRGGNEDELRNDSMGQNQADMDTKPPY